MNKVAFIGSYDKADLMLYVAKVLTILGKKVILVDATALQKTRYIIPKMTQAKKYITTFENIDVAIGFESFGEIKKYKELEDTAKLDYDYALVNIDSYRGYYNFKIQTEDKRFFVTSFDVYSLKRGLEVFGGVETTTKLTKVLFSKDMKKEEDEYLEFLAMNYNIEWEKERIYFPFERGDQSIIFENQRTSRIKFKNLSSQYKDSLTYLASGLLETEGVSSGEIRKAVRKIEKGV